MCGIVGYIGKKEAIQVLIKGLERLEYRGYDSSGIAFFREKSVFLEKSVGRIAQLRQKLNPSLSSTCGIAHTRWASHGQVTEVNAHPQVSQDQKVYLIHNGIIENFIELATQLENKGYHFSSQTDTEVLCNLISDCYRQLGNGHFIQALIDALKQVQGSYALGILCADLPNTLFAIRKDSPLWMGKNAHEQILASDPIVFEENITEALCLPEDHLVEVTPEDYQFYNLSGKSLELTLQPFKAYKQNSQAFKHTGFENFMSSEIAEQPRIIQETLMRYWGGNEILFPELNSIDSLLNSFNYSLFCACGSAFYASLMAKYWMEYYAQIPTEAVYASEFRYTKKPIPKNTLFCTISQSGETFETIEALRSFQKRNIPTLGICNNPISSIARENTVCLHQEAGPEIGVASTKAFSSQMLLGLLLSLHVAKQRQTVTPEQAQEIQKALFQLPLQMEKVLAQKSLFKKLGLRYAKYPNLLYLGRQALFPVALEGALKLKELAYIHAEASPAAEMKHGPLAMIDENFPSIFLALQEGLWKKNLSGIQEIAARNGPLMVFVSEGHHLPKNLKVDVITLPKAHETTQPFLATLALQLFAYYTAQARGCDVDKPRNLAKSVTIE